MNRVSLLLVVIVLGMVADRAAGRTEEVGGREVYPGAEWETATPAEVGMDEGRLARARDYALTGGGAGVVVRGGKVVMAWGDTRERFDLKSTTKSFGATMLGVAIGDGKVRLGDRAAALLPGFGVPPGENGGWAGEVTVAQLATQTAGFEKPGGFGRLLFRPGTRWHYSDGGPNWLADCLTVAYGRDLKDVMFERVLGPIGVRAEDLTWRENAYRDRTIHGVKRREFGSGISANVEAMARVGYLYLRGGTWEGKQILPAEFVEKAGKTPVETKGLAAWEADAEHGDASVHYGLLWWNNADGALGKVGQRETPRDAYWAWGLGDSLIVVVPSLDLVVARAGKAWKREAGGRHYDVLKGFVGEVCEGVVRGGGFQ